MIVRFSKTKRAFTVVELLITLAITAMILAAVAVAFNASAISYQQNEDLFKTLNKARQALIRITTQLRTANAVDTGSSTSECSLITSDGDDITYQYNSTDDKLYLITNDDLLDDDYVLCDNVTAMTFQKETATRDSDLYVKSVQISITVEGDDTQQTLAAAAVVRKNLE